MADGITHVVHKQTRTLVKKGHDVTVYTSNALNLHGVRGSKINDSVKYVGGVKVRYFPYILRYGTMFFSPSMFYSIRDEVKEFDIIHIHDARCFQSAVTAYYSKVYNIPIIYQPHGSFKSNSHGGFFRFLSRGLIDKLYAERIFKKADRVIALNQTEAEKYRCMGVRDEKIEIIPNGIDLSEYTDLPSKGEFKKKYNIPAEKKIILYVGRIHRTKGIDFLLKAFAYLINKMKFKDALLVVVGPDDGYLHEVKSLSASLGVSTSVLYTGLISNKDKISAYVDSSICCYLNPNEPFGLVSLEAAASKLPVVVSEGTPMSEIVKRSGFGFSITYGDVLALVKTMETVLKDEKLSNEMGKCGREYVFENFGWDTIIDKYEMLYGNICACALY